MCACQQFHINYRCIYVSLSIALQLNLDFFPARLATLPNMGWFKCYEITSQPVNQAIFLILFCQSCFNKICYYYICTVKYWHYIILQLIVVITIVLIKKTNLIRSFCGLQLWPHLLRFTSSDFQIKTKYVIQIKF